MGGRVNMWFWSSRSCLVGVRMISNGVLVEILGGCFVWVLGFC